MTKIKLTDNLSLSQIIRGFWRLDTWELSTDELIDNMKSSIDLGVTSFDTAEIYADTLCESQIGEAFAKDPALRGKVELISKTGIYKQEINGESFGYYNTTYDRIVRSIFNSQRRPSFRSMGGRQSNAGSEERRADQRNRSVKF